MLPDRWIARLREAADQAGSASADHEGERRPPAEARAAGRLNAIFLAIVLVAFGTAAWRELFSIVPDGAPSPMQALSSATIASAAEAVTLAIGLVGALALFLG